MNAPDDQLLRFCGLPIPRTEDARLTTGVGDKAPSAAPPGHAE